MNPHGDGVEPLTDDQRALVTANTRLVPFFLNRLGDPMDGSTEDDIQDGMFGLMLAAQSWDASKGTFSNYSLRAIRWHIQRGRYLRGGVSYRYAARRRQWYRQPDSLDAPIRTGPDNDESPLTLGDRLVDEPQEPSTAHERAEQLLAAFTDRDRMVVLLPSSEAADVLGIKQSSVLRQRHRLYDRLRAQVAS